MNGASLERRFLVAGVGDPGPVLVIGGAGFIGSNLAHALLSMGQPVRVFDNLSRPGVEHNLWLREVHTSARATGKGHRPAVLIHTDARADARSPGTPQVRWP